MKATLSVPVMTLATMLGIIGGGMIVKGYPDPVYVGVGALLVLVFLAANYIFFWDE